MPQARLEQPGQKAERERGGGCFDRVDAPSRTTLDIAP
jgi:hypothetical protein